MRPVAQIAQSVEQGIENPRVGGSIPSLGTKYRETPKEPCVLGGFLLPAILWLLDHFWTKAL